MAYTAAQKALLRLLEKDPPRAVFPRRNDPARQADIRRCVRAGLLASAGYETTVVADDWLNHLPAEPVDV